LETLEQTAPEVPKPVLVKHKRRDRSPKVTPSSSPETAPAAAMPDHSRVPAPQKRLLDPKAFFEYWHSVPEPERSAWFIGYVYRKYPICDIYQNFSKEEILAFNANKGKQKIVFQGRTLERPESNCGKLLQPLDPERWELQVYERWGAGDYQIRLNDQHPSMQETVTECHIRGLRDWDNFSPVLNPALVVLAEELNQPYLRWARLHGIKFPGDPETEAAAESAASFQENEDMATVVETMARHNEALTDKVVEMADRVRVQPAPAPAVDAAARAQLGGVETVVEASKQGMSIMGDAMRQMMASTVKAADPGEQLKNTIEMAKLLQPPANGNADMVAMFKMQMDSQREQARIQLEQTEKNFIRLLDAEREHHKSILTMLQSRIDSLEKQRAEAPAVTGDEAVLDKYLRIRRKMTELEDEEGGGGSDGGPAWLPAVLGFGEKVIGGIAESTRNIAAIRAQQAAPVVVPEPQALPVAAPAVQTQQDKDNEMMRGYAQQMHRPIVDAIKAGVPGFDFAAAVIQNAGQGAYDTLEKSGYDGVVRFLQCYQPLWEELMLPPIGGPALEKFLREFLDRPKAMQAFELLKAKVQPTTRGRGPTVNN